MAECKQVLAVCAPLCFVFSKFNKLDQARIKSVLVDFFMRMILLRRRKDWHLMLSQFKRIKYLDSPTVATVMGGYVQPRRSMIFSL